MLSTTKFKLIIISSLITFSLIILFPTDSYSYLGFNYKLEEKNNDSELLNKIIEPTINYVSLKNEIDIDIDNDDIEIDIDKNFHKDRHYDDFFDYDSDIDVYDIDDLDIVCFENDDDDDTVCYDDDDDTVCYDDDDIDIIDDDIDIIDDDIDIDDINNHDVIFLNDYS